LVESDILLEVHDLKKHFPIRRGIFKKVVGHVKAVDGVSFTIRRGETLGVAGESGCGKTTVGRMIMGAYRPTAGNIWFHPPDGEPRVDLTNISPQEMRPLRKHLQMVFQDPFASLNPRMTDSVNHFSHACSTLPGCVRLRATKNIVFDRRRSGRKTRNRIKGGFSQT
jgi:ABC-type oligopeptide transport system ATPase subunit